MSAESESADPVSLSVSGRAEISQIASLIADSEKVSQQESEWKARRNSLKNANRELDIELKRILARGAIWLMLAQIVVTDVVFVLYGWLGRDWDIPANVILGWMGATVVQVIGIVLTISAYLFPKRRSRKYRS